MRHPDTRPGLAARAAGPNRMEGARTGPCVVTVPFSPMLPSGGARPEYKVFGPKRNGETEERPGGRAIRLTPDGPLH